MNKNINTLQWYDHLGIGAVSRAIAISIMYPLDTMKTLIQNNASTKAEALVYWHHNYYKGYTYALATQSLYGMTVFGTYENFKNILSNHVYTKATPNIYIYLHSALLADFTGSLLLCPIEVVKQNIQIARYDKVSHAFMDIMKHYDIQGFYRGYYGLLLRDLPFRAIQLPLYDKLKDSYIENKKSDTLNSGTTASLGAIAGMVAGSFTTPTDVIKTHMMCNSSQQSFFATFSYIYKIKGMSGFFAGLPQRIIFLGGSSAIFFMCYEKLREYVH
jgi:solute carrier family 25 S-adenosylmethionine transporter 26